MSAPAFIDDAGDADGEVQKWETALEAMERWCEQVRSRYVPTPPPHLPNCEVPAELVERARLVKRRLILIEMELTTRREATRTRVNSLGPTTYSSGTYA